MKKITLLFSFLAIIFSYQSFAQYGCASAVVLTDGYSAFNITTPGTGGVEDWNTNPTVTCGGVSNSYWDDDVYLYTYTAGITPEDISMTVFTRNSWNGLGIFSTCTGVALDGCIDTLGSGGSSSISQTVNATLSAGQTVYLAVGQWGTPDDLDFDVTDFTVTPIVSAPNCTALTDPLDTATGVSEDNDLTWTAATGGPTGYKLIVGTTPGGTDVLNSVDVGNVTTYDLGTLSYSTTYYVTVVPYNGNGDATGCTEESFTTRTMPAAGEVCSNPIVVGALPYNTSDDTATYGDDYSGSPGASCSSTNGYLNGDDVVYSYSPGSNTSIDVDLTGIGSDYAGIFIYTDCADIGTTCQNGATNGAATGDLSISDYLVSSGTTYYIVISTWATPQSTTYTLDITENTCTNSTATYTPVPDCGNTQFTVDVDVTSLGSATSVTIGDDQASPTQQVFTTGIVSFGPYASGTSVNFTVTNDQDGTCVINGNGTYACPPANDALCNVISLTIDVAGTSGMYTNTAATEEVSEPAGGCYSGGVQGSVWFSFVAPASGEVQVSTDIGGTMTDSEIAVYDATGVTCSDLSTLPAELGCDQDGGTVVGSGYMSVLDLTVANGNAVTPGVTYYVQVSGYFDNRGSFGIKVFDQVTLLSVKDLQLIEGFKIGPNPTEDFLNISAKNSIDELQVVNMLGQVVKTATPNMNNYQLNLSELSTGVYFVKATVNNTKGTYRIVKK